MKIAVINTCVPYYYGGAESHANTAAEKLREAGHQVTNYRLPFSWNPHERIIESLLAMRGLCFDAYDKVVGFKFPAYCVEHPNKTVWLLHQFRQAYDLWGTPFQGIPDTLEGRKIRRAIVAADQLYLGSAKKIYTNSPVTKKRLWDFNRIEGTTLYHPLPDESVFYAADYQDYIFCPSRISMGKRQHLLVEAMHYVKTPVKLILAGLPESQEDLIVLTRLIEKHKLQNKVVIHAKFISETEKVDLLAHALSVAYIPYDEDSYGYVTLEAYHSRRPVITCTDSGGIHILVKDNISGRVVEPDAKAIAEAIDKMYSNKSSLAKMGNAGFAMSQQLEISWDNAVKRLLE